MGSDSGDGKRPRFFVVAVGARAPFHRTIATALADLAGGTGPGDDSLREFVTDGPAPGRREPWPDAYAQALTRSRRFLDRALPAAEIRLVHAETLADAARRLRRLTAGRRDGDDAIALLLIESEPADAPTGPLAGGGLAEGLDELRAVLPAHTRGEFGAYTVFVYDDSPLDPVRLAHPCTRRQLPGLAWVLGADVICSFTDYVQLCYAGSALRGAAPDAPALLADELAGFLAEQAGDTWGLHYYTGSVVSGLIADLETRATRGGNPVLRGPSEHSLACGALARWQLDEAPFLIVVTSGMIDEFRGTLANLREARARGFIVCADSRPDAWYPFQGTVHGAEDSREVLRARGLEFRYLDDPARLREQLAEAFTAYGADRGPVVLLATPEVLRTAAVAAPAARPGGRTPEDATPGASPGSLPAGGPAARARPRLVVGEDDLAPVMDIINDGPARLLWQCGRLGAEESALVHDIADRAGVALADSLTRPGSVARYRDGKAVPQYLGTLGVFGYSDRVHAFLHHAGRLRPRDEQCLFFLKSRIAEAATPFSPRALQRSLRIVQITREEQHLAPFADHRLRCDGLEFLREVRRRLDVPEPLRARRMRAIEESRDSPSDIVHALPLVPMSPNYFFRRLGAVLDTLITDHGYTYTGVFDVGRGGLSAIRNLPRTGPGFSGWYGRSLMGDALQAVPALALSRGDNVLAFVGDGALALVPGIVPTLVQEVCVNGHRLAGNVSVFQLIDGGHSVIRTYREGRRAGEAERQTQVLHLMDDEWERKLGGLTVTHRRLTDVDPVELTDRLLRRSAVDVYSVPLAHNNEGDGLSLLSSLGWQRDTLPELTFAMARRPGPSAHEGELR
ncbi:hypothetical protein AR457_29580 [Streptomyces agglomeratus]|uniref:Thiamine pyrophosphate-binding protein n=1 Tax=Streptomyces agglomeratus TaxID=285458 RepID=A0A1E5PEP6_9ACTN|nr:hypothetical protein [Streptomyces agglomeratus]OEJ28003.1 hypothetical protein AS594_29465 [Streptomyces agglomeratus]OEJ37936.1 hypothetical protein BGK70_07070 [Streptomyces agglomeratus]OEJ47682.1 hypothetical protein AR457_29580 [Streptomyces agglomeratus]OEJ50464.1 hypothetical protein BGK72_06545 [Streptomyces agglomeratus]